MATAPSDVPDQTGFREKLKEEEYRQKFSYSMYVAAAFFGLGVTGGLEGSAFLDLQLITDSDVTRASAFFTSVSAGFAAGSTISGVLGTKVNRSLLMFLSMLGVSALSIVTPFCSLYAVMITAKLCYGTVAGIASTVGNAEQMRLWGDEGRVLLQLLHCSYAVGCVLGPLVAEPFLAEKERLDADINQTLVKTLPETWTNNITIQGLTPSTTDIEDNVTEANHRIYISSNMFLPENITTDDAEINATSTRIHYAYIIAAVINFLSAFPFLYALISRKKSSSNNLRENDKTRQTTTRKNSDLRVIPKGLKILLWVFLCAFFFFNNGVEITFGSFLMTFVVRKFADVSKSQGAYIAAVYWASFAGSRILMIFAANFLTPLVLLATCLSIMLASFILFTIMAQMSLVTGITIATAMSAIGMAAIFPSTLSWSESRLLHVTSSLSASIITCSALGSMVNPLLIGYLIDEYSNMWFCYILLIQLAVLGAIFSFLNGFNRIFVVRKYGPLRRKEISYVSAEYSSDLKSAQDRDIDGFHDKEMETFDLNK